MNKTVKILLAVLFLLIGSSCLLGGCAYQGYLKTIRMDEDVKAQWAEVENQLQRRFDLVGNLVETVKGYAQQEQDIFLGVANARKAYFNAENTQGKVQAANMFESALSRLLVLRETYPELRSNENFLKLQDSLEGTENRLAVARKRYNDSVRSLNAYIRGPLGGLYASWANVEKAVYFEVEEAAKETPKVDFTKDSETSGGED